MHVKPQNSVRCREREKDIIMGQQIIWNRIQNKVKQWGTGEESIFKWIYAGIIFNFDMLTGATDTVSHFIGPSCFHTYSWLFPVVDDKIEMG